MKTAVLIIPLCLTTIAPAGIINIDDQRFARVVSYVREGIVADTYAVLYLPNGNPIFSGDLDHTVTMGNAGLAHSTMIYSSSFSDSIFQSQASVSSNAALNVFNGSSWSTAAVGTHIFFTIDETTTFQIDGTLSSTGNWGVSEVAFLNTDLENFFFARSADDSLDIHATLTLEAGEYHYYAKSVSSATGVENLINPSLAAHNITVTVIPAPASTALLLLTGSTLITRRRR
ncbi:MAG: PEP-CTERM sorting domain-containing protein [Phycisphaerales bacterium]|nr:PEP-CTERM sorting domain-containing protein [Phycisphaerales bacterium]